MDRSTSAGRVGLRSDARFRPVVAVDVDGVLRVEAPDSGETPPEGVFRRRVTVTREGYPLVFHREPEWDEHDQWSSHHWFSGVGAEWLRDLLDRGVEVVWATTWQHAANQYFAKRLGVPQLPVAVKGGPQGSWTASMWKAAQLGAKFPGRPLLWVDDTRSREALNRLDWARRPRDRAVTHFHWVTDWAAGITRDDIIEMDQWLALASTPDGHDELRRQRRRAQARDRYWTRPRPRGSHAQYMRWNEINTRLRVALGPDDIVVRLLGDDALDHPDGLDPAAITALIDQLGSDTTASAADIIRIIRDHRRPDER